MSNVNEAGKINNEHDVGYRYLLKAKQVYIQLLKQIVLKRFPEEHREEIAQTIDQANPKEVNQMISNLGEELERFYKEAQERGKKEGREEGIEKGKKENAIKVAKHLLSKGMSLEEIAEITELDKEEVEKLKDNQN